MTDRLGPPAVFVYGTLLPGHSRWPLVSPFVEAHSPAAVAGHLFDTRRDYPAAVFAHDRSATAFVHGALLALRAGRVEAALEVLDLVEGSEYRRCIVTTSDGEPAWTYEWAAGWARLHPIPDGRWIGE